MRIVSLALLCIGSAEAFASGPLVVEAEAVIGAPTVAEGAGAPALAWVDDQGRLVMFYETRVDVVGCSEAWAIGSASSTDLAKWTIQPAKLEPNATFPCGARRPAPIVADDGTRWLFFEVVDPVAPGIGVMRKSGGHRDVARLATLDGLGSPTVALHGGDWVLMAVRADGAVVTARSADAITWTLDAADAIPANALPWATTPSSPSLICHDGPDWAWELWHGGHDTTGVGGWSYLISEDAAEWYTAEPFGAPTDTWLSWDVLRMGDARLVAYEDLDIDGLPRIGIATDGTLDVASVSGRTCAP